MAKRIESRGALDIAKRSLQTCGQIMRFAVAHGVIERNPSADVKPSDALKPRRKENYARLDAKEVPELLRKIEAYQGSSYTRLAMKLMAYTFVRTEPPQVLRRLFSLRGLSHEQEVEPVFTRGPRTRCSHGARAPQRVPLPVGRH
jgi:integrase